MMNELWMADRKIRKAGVKSLYLFFMCAVCTFALSGCVYKEPQYSEEQEHETAERGAVIMEEWMRKYYPDGEVRTTSPHIYYIPSASSYLTAYVEGIMYDGEREREFSVNVSTGDVFLEADEDMQENFMTCAANLYLTSLDLPLDTDIEGFDAYVGYDYGSISGIRNDEIYTSECLPGELVAEKGDVEGYVNDLSRNGIICVRGHINVGNDTDIGVYNLEDLIERQERFRISYSSFGMSNAYEELVIGRYKRYEYVEWEGREAFALVEEREDRNLGDGKIESETREPDINSSAWLKKDGDAYVIEFSEAPNHGYFELYVQGGDELLENEYTAVTGLGKGETRLEDELTWQADENGHGFTLCKLNGSRYSFHRTTRLEIRDSDGTEREGDND